MINDLAFSIVSKQVREKDMRRKRLIQINYQDNALISQVKIKKHFFENEGKSAIKILKNVYLLFRLEIGLRRRLYCF